MRRVTIVDIANSLGITPSTVSRALAGNPRVNLATRDRVLSMALKLGYQPNHIASSLRKGKSDTVGMLVPRINRHFFSHVISAVEEVLNPAGYNLMICQSYELLSREAEAINALIKNRVAGIIISHAMEATGSIHLLRAINEGIPVVQFDRVRKDLPGPKIVNDNFSGAYMAVKHLINNGYKRVAHLTGALGVNVYAERFAGYTRALSESSINFDQELMFEGSITRVSAREKVKTLLKENPVDALFCAGDYAALGAYDGVRELGMQVGEDIGVVGFANEPFSDIISPGLTTVEQNASEIGNRSAVALIDIIANGVEGNENIEYLVPVRLLPRESSTKVKPIGGAAARCSQNLDAFNE